jgi:hypothetical protein
MVDMSAIAGAVVSLKSAGEIAKSLLTLRDGSMLQGKVIELQAEILSAQEGTLAAQSAQFALLERIRELEAEVAKVKAWDAEKQRYQLADVGLGSLAYVLKPEAQGTEPAHAICANCYQHQNKSILQKDLERGFEVVQCHTCKARLRIKDRPLGFA